MLSNYDLMLVLANHVIADKILLNYTTWHACSHNLTIYLQHLNVIGPWYLYIHILYFVKLLFFEKKFMFVMIYDIISCSKIKNIHSCY